jgi:phage terminase large subunit
MKTCHNCNLRALTTPKTEEHKKQPTYLECRGCGAFHLTYEPLPHQEDFHKTKQAENVDENGKPDGTLKTQIIGLFGGFGSAKSRASLQEIFIRSLNNPGGTGLLTAPTLLQLKRTTIKTLLNEVIPPPLIRSYNKSEGELILENGFTFYLIPSDDEEKLRSLNCGLIHMEEASGISESIYTQLLTRLRDHATKDKLIIVCSNPSLGWIKNIFYDNVARSNPKHPEHNQHNPNIVTYIWKSYQNPFLPRDFVDNISKGKPEWWKRRYIDGSFDQVDGAVYPRVGEAIIKSQNVADTWERVVSIDVGLRNPTALLIGAIDPQTGNVHIFKEYYKANTLVPEHARNIKQILEEEKVTAGNTRFMVIDPAAGNKTDPINGKSIQGLYQEYGLYFSKANNSLDAGILKVNAYIEMNKLKIHDTCPNLIRELQNYQYPDVEMEAKDKNLKEKPIKANDHAADALRYMLMRLPDDPNNLKTSSHKPPDRYIIEEDEDNTGKKGDFLSYI